MKMEREEEMKLLSKEIKKIEEALYIRDLYVKRIEEDRNLLEVMKARMIKLEAEAKQQPE
jgi:hypothetical protein